MNTMKPDISLSEQIPVTEPERQYYYIEKAKEYVRKEAEEPGSTDRSSADVLCGNLWVSDECQRFRKTGRYPS